MAFQIPEKLDDLTIEQLNALEAEAVAEFDELKADENLDAEGLKRLQALAGFVKAARTQVQQIEAAEAETQRQLEALEAEVHPAEPDEGGDGSNSPPDGEADADAADAVEKAPVLAAGRAAGRGTVVRKRKEPETASLATKVFAAAGLGTKEAGGLFSNVDEIADAFDDRRKTFPTPGDTRGRRGRQFSATRLKHGVARFERALQPGEKSFEVGEKVSFWDQIDTIGSTEHQKLLNGGSLVAAGGWCAPNLQTWDLCPGLETVDGIATWPSFVLTRGGIQYPVGFDFSTFYSAATVGFHQTEADSIAGTDKLCYDIPCPTFTSARLEIDGICFKQDIVQNSVWPEVTRHVMSRAMTAHEHKINARLIAQVETASTAVTLPLGTDVDGDNTTSGLFGSLVLLAVHTRYKYRMTRTATIEGKAPSWLRDWVQADMARRAGVDYWNLPAGWVDTQLAARNIVIDWVVDWQDGYITNTLFGGTAFNGQWPATVTVMMWPPGTWVKGGNGIIDLSAVYDSTGLTDNEYTAAFTEESTLLIQKCYASFKAAIPLCPTGATSQLAAFDCTAN